MLWQIGLVDRRVHFCTKGRVNLLQSFGIWVEPFANTEEGKRTTGPETCEVKNLEDFSLGKYFLTDGGYSFMKPSSLAGAGAVLGNL